VALFTSLWLNIIGKMATSKKLPKQKQKVSPLWELRLQNERSAQKA
jgi:hypothetical protein